MKKKTRLALTVAIIAASATITASYIQKNGERKSDNDVTSEAVIKVDQLVKSSTTKDSMNSSGEQSPIINNTSGNVEINY